MTSPSLDVDDPQPPSPTPTIAQPLAEHGTAQPGTTQPGTAQRNSTLVDGANLGSQGSGRSGLATLLPLVGSLVIVAAVSLACWQWQHIFADLGFVGPTVVSSVAAGAVALISHRLGWSRPAGLVTMLAVLGVGLGALYRLTIGELPGDVVASWKALASTGLLLPTSPRFVLVPVIVAGLATWLALDLFLRRGTAALSAVVILLAHGTALAYTTSQHNPSLWYVGVLALLVLGQLAISGMRRPGDTEFADHQVSISARQFGATAAVVLAVTAITAGLSTLVETGSESFDLRSRLVPPLDIAESATPLARVKAGLVDADNDSVFEISLDGLGPDETVQLLPVAVLDRFDGRIWSTAATFEPAGSNLPLPTQSPAIGSVVSQNVTLTADYPFQFLPVAGVARTVTAGDTAWDPRSGTMAAMDLDDRTFQGQVALVNPQATPGDGPIPGNNPTSLSDEQRDALNAYLAEVIDSDDDPVVQLEKIEAHLASDAFGYNIDAPAGHSLAALVSFLSLADANGGDDAVSAGRIGFSEHSAASFAVLARQLGIPSRVVVGYRLDEPLSTDANEQIVTTNMIHAWPEAWLEDRGWVRFEPTNTLNQTNDQAARTPTVSSAGVDANRTDLPDLEEPVLLAEAEPVAKRSNWWWLAGLAVVPVLYAGLIVLAKYLRRLRRRRRPSDLGVVGAWREVMDRFGELGLPAGRSLSATDVADQLEVIDLRDVATPVATLAPTLDTALYAPQPASDADTGAAWAASSEAVAKARRSTSKGSRVRAMLDPRALFVR